MLNRLRIHFKSISAAFCSKLWAKAWAKRLLNLGSLLRAERRKQAVARAGAILAPTYFLAEALLVGNRRNFRVGAFSFVGRCEIMLPDVVQIGANVCINDGLTSLTASHDFLDPGWGQYSRPIVIEDHAWVATGAMLLPGARIGKGAVAGAGSVMPPYAIAVGNPAVILEKLRCETLTYRPTLIEIQINH